MSPLKMNQSADAWMRLYKVGGTAALIMAVFIPIQTIIFIVWPPPGTVIGWFMLFQRNHLLGLLSMDILLIVNQVLMVLVLLALYVALRRANQSFMAISLILGLVGIAIYFALIAALKMLSPSNAEAITNVLMSWSISMSLPSGQAMLTIWEGTPFDVGYALESVALLIIASVILQSTIFSKKTAYVGILMGVMSLVQAGVGVVGPTVGMIDLFFALGSLVLLEIWDILISRRLFQLGRSFSKEEANRN